jgi:DNA invertase Pin-like site-specific DNA recombinase
MIYGYARVSTDGQSLEAQQSALKAAGCERVYSEKLSGAKTDNRKALAAAIKALGAGDTLIVTRLDRLVRSTRDLLNTLASIADGGASFKSLSDSWADTTTPHGRLMLTVLGGLAEFERSLILARTSEGRAQQPAMPVIGFLSSAAPQSYAHVVAAFRQGLKEVGYVEGQNITTESLWADGQYDRLPMLAAELVRRQVAVIATTGTPSAFAAKAATTTIPIVFEIGFDPVAVGLVTSLNRPGGNLTGVTNLGVEVGAKQLALLHELVPTATTIALLVNPTNRTLAEAVDALAPFRIAFPVQRCL